VTALRQLAGRRGQPTGASWLGKAKTMSQIVAVAAVIIWPKAAPLLLLALALTVVSGLDYLVRWRQVLRRANKPTPSAAG